MRDSSRSVPQVELIVNPSDEVIPKLREDFGLERVDFVFMDHWKKCYAPDLQVTLNSLAASSSSSQKNQLTHQPISGIPHSHKNSLFNTFVLSPAP